MLNVHTVMPMGNRSQGVNCDTPEKAETVFAGMLGQMQAWKQFTADLVMTDEGKEIKREHIENA
jgi:hypothetical protein